MRLSDSCIIGVFLGATALMFGCAGTKGTPCKPQTAPRGGCDPGLYCCNSAASCVSGAYEPSVPERSCPSAYECAERCANLPPSSPPS